MSVRIMVGDCRDRLQELPEQSIQTVVTSPPYFALRDYGVEGQMGLEQTPAEFIGGMVEVFRSVRRVLRDDGTLWVNMGDGYATNGSRVGNSQGECRGSKGTLTGYRSTPIVFKPKDLMMMPARLAIALCDDGWYLRSDVIWHKPNPMPESCRDRPTKAHEYIFLLSKKERYHYDADAITEEVSENTHLRLSQDVAAQIGSTRADRPMKAVKRPAGWATSAEDYADFHGKGGVGKGRYEGSKTAENAPGVKNNESFSDSVALPVDRRNKRTVWTVPTYGFRGAHFATFPPALIEPCIRAGAPLGSTVLDPFGGAGTTALVAERNGRDSIMIELNPEYAAMARDRIHDDNPLFSSVSVEE